MTKTRRVLIGITVVLIALWGSPSWAAAGKAYIYYSPETGAGLTKAAVIAEDVEGLRGFQVRITFDPKVVQAQSVKLGSLFADSLTAVNRVDNQKGELFYSTAKPGYGVTGTTDLLWFELKGIAPGDPQLRIADGGVVIVDSTMRETTLSSNSGTLNVAGAGAPPLPSEKTLMEKPLLHASLNKAKPIVVDRSGPGDEPSQPKQRVNGGQAGQTGSGDSAASAAGGSAAGGSATVGTAAGGSAAGGPGTDGSAAGGLAGEDDPVGKTLTVIGGVLLVVLAGYQIYHNRRHRRRKRYF